MGLLFDDSNDQQGELPIARVYFSQVKSGKIPAPTEVESCLRAIFISSSQEWLILETGCCKAFLHTGSKASKILIKSLEKALADTSFGEPLAATGLMIIPSKSKAGFDLEKSKVAGQWTQPKDSDDRAMFRFEPDVNEVLHNSANEECLLEISPLTPKPGRKSTRKTKVAPKKDRSSD